MTEIQSTDGDKAQDAVSTKFAALNIFKKHTEEEIQQIIEGSAKLVDHFADVRGSTTSRAEFAQLISLKMDEEHMDYTQALFESRREAYLFRGVSQPISMINGYEQDTATVTVTVERTDEPDMDSIDQTALVTDDDSDSHIHCFIFSDTDDQPVLSEGDTVEIKNARVQMHQNKVEGGIAVGLDVDDQTEITFLEDEN